MRGGLVGRLAFAVALFATAFNLLALAGVVFGDANPYLDVAAQFLGPLSFVAVLAAAMALASRQWLGAVAAGIVVGIGLFVVWPRPVLEACGPHAITHRVVFQNVWASNADPQSVVTYLAGTNADAIVLAESWYRTRAIFDRLKAIYPYTVDCAGGAGCGTVVYSKFPFTDHTQAARRPGGPRAMIEVAIAFPDGVLELFGVHMTRPWPFTPVGDQPRQTKALAASFAALPAQSLLIGDLNAVTWGHVVRAIEKESGGRALPSWGTWRTNFPLPFRIPIDQAIVGPGIACAVKTAGRRTSSDHRPILIDFALQPAAR